MGILWIYFVCFLTVAVATVRTIATNEKDNIDTVAGETFVIRTWAYSGIPLYVTISMDHKILMTASLNGSHDSIICNKTDRMMLKYDATLKKGSLVLCNSNISDEGLYQMDEGIYETSNDIFKRQHGKWNLQLNIYDPDDMKAGNVGENTILMQLKSSSVISHHLYYYDQIVATLVPFECYAKGTTHLYGRLKCTENRKISIYTIEIQNVTQRDTGLYKVVYENREIERCFLNITDKPIYYMVGENASLSWYYNQQGMNRTLRIIHPNEGLMMMLQPSNNSTIMSNFQNRVLYSGDISRSYMSFSLMNLRKSDTGIYTIETLHGNSIPGGQKLNVKDTMPITIRGFGTQYAIFTEKSTNDWFRSLEPGINKTNTPSIVTRYTSSAESSTKGSLGQPNSLEPAAPNSIYFIPVVIGSGALIIVMIGCLIRIQRKNDRHLEAVHRLILEKPETASFATPSTLRKPLQIHTAEDGITGRSLPQFNTPPNAIPDLPYAFFPSTSASFDTAFYSTYSLPQLESDTPRLNYTANCNESHGRSNEKTLVGCVGDIDTDENILNSSSLVWPLMSPECGAEQNYKCIGDGYGQRSVSRNIQALYAKVKKEPKLSSKNTRTLRKKNALIHGTREEDEYETYETVINRRSVESVQFQVNEDGDTIATKNEEPTEQQVSSGIAYDDYADIKL